MQDKNKQVSSFPNRLNEAIKRNSLRKKDLAIKLDVDANAISRYCTGKNMPSSVELHRLSHTLNVSMNWLMGDAEAEIDKNADLWKAKYDDCQKELESLRNALKLLVNNVSK